MWKLWYRNSKKSQTWFPSLVCKYFCIFWNIQDCCPSRAQCACVFSNQSHPREHRTTAWHYRARVGKEGPEKRICIVTHPIPLFHPAMPLPPPPFRPHGPSYSHEVQSDRLLSNPSFEEKDSGRAYWQNGSPAKRNHLSNTGDIFNGKLVLLKVPLTHRPCP